jgi:flagellar hook-basal body complex protein FliE
MASIIDNPIPKNAFFATPESMQALEDQIMKFSGQERMIAMVSAMMALNLAHDLIEKEIQAWPKVESFGYQGA